jgi:hypothetical protein
MAAGGVQTITTIRLPDGQQVGFVDWEDKQGSSTCELAHGFVQQELILFGYTEGDPIPSAPPAGFTAIPKNSTRRHTNQQAPGAMASTEERMIYAIKPEIFALTADEPEGNEFDFTTAEPRDATGEPNPNPVMLKWLHYKILVRLLISMKEYASAGLGYFNTGFGVFSMGGTMGPAVAAGRTYANHGFPSQEAVRSYVIPKYIGGQEKFQLSVNNPGGLPVNFGFSENGAIAANLQAVVQIIFHNDGLYKRPVS